MSRVLLVDDSPHAQRMGERILAEEGYEVVTVSNAEAALIRLADVDPDVIVADTVMPGRSGYDVCQYVKLSPQHRHVGVILTAGVLEKVDEAEAQRVEADGVLHKPFEASALLAAVRPLAERAQQARSQQPEAAVGETPAPPRVEVAAPFVVVVDAEQVRAAVTVAFDASMERMVEEITRHVLASLESQEATRKTPAQAEPAVAAEDAMVVQAAPPDQERSPWPGPVRKVTLLRRRTGSILGLDMDQSSDDAPQE
jgi:DNA-binding response OmpR family regulator